MNAPEPRAVSFGPIYCELNLEDFGLELENLIHTTIEKIESVSASLAKISDAGDAPAVSSTVEKSKELLRQLGALAGSLETLSQRLGTQSVETEET